MVHAKGRYITNLFKKLEQFQNISSTKRVTANKIKTKYKEQCQMLQSMRKNKTTMSDQSRVYLA